MSCRAMRWAMVASQVVCARSMRSRRAAPLARCTSCSFKDGAEEEEEEEEGGLQSDWKMGPTFAAMASEGFRRGSGGSSHKSSLPPAPVPPVLRVVPVLFFFFKN